MHIQDFRTKEEYCMIGYYPTPGVQNMSRIATRTYINDITGKLGNNIPINNTKLEWDTNPNDPADILEAGSEKETDQVKKKAKKAKNLGEDFMSINELSENYEEEFWGKH